MSADVSLVIPVQDGEVRISLHPISLALVLAEVIEEKARRRCLRRGHAKQVEGYCERCGTSLPDDGTPYGSWYPPLYRSWAARPATTEGAAPTTESEEDAT